MSELIPCPFCGEQVFPPLASSLDDGYTRCGLCGAKMQHRRWQTRPIEDALQARIAELGLELGRKSVELGELVGRDILWKVINDELKSRRENLERENDLLQEKVSDLLKRIAELEAEQARWVMVSERLPNKSGWYLAGLIGWAGGYYTAEVYFDTETGLPWRSSVRDEVYCWLDGVPELPQPPEVQE